MTTLAEQPKLSPEYDRYDAASCTIQAIYFRATKIELGSLVIAGLIAAAPTFISTNHATWLAIAFAIAMASALGSRVLQQVKRWKSGWYNSRSSAESLKTQSWLYMMKAGAYSQSNARVIFGKALANILKNETNDKGVPASASPAAPQAISSYMETVRRLTERQRYDIYMKHRFHDQLVYFQRRAGEHESEARRFSIYAAILEIIALTLGAYFIYANSFNSLVGALITIAAAFGAWIHIRNGERIAHSYRVISQDLTILNTKFGKITSSSDFFDFVEQTENALAREHAQWVENQ